MKYLRIYHRNEVHSNMSWANKYQVGIVSWSIYEINLFFKKSFLLSNTLFM